MAVTLPIACRLHLSSVHADALERAMRHEKYQDKKGDFSRKSGYLRVGLADMNRSPLVGKAFTSQMQSLERGLSQVDIQSNKP